MCQKTHQAQFIAAAPFAMTQCACATTPVLMSAAQAGGQTVVSRSFPVLAAKDGSFVDYPPAYTADVDEALVHTYGSFHEEPAVALLNTRRDDNWTLCVPVTVPALRNPTLLSVNYMVKYATTADAGNATIQTDVMLSTAALPAEIVSARAPLAVYRASSSAPRMVDQAAAVCLATSLAVKSNAGGEEWSHYVDTQHVAPNVRVRDSATQLYLVFTVEEHSTLRTARSLSVEVSATWQKEEVELKARAEAERKAKEAADKEAQLLAEKKAREAEEKQAREEERAWREEERQARKAEAKEREDAKQARDAEQKWKEEMRVQWAEMRKTIETMATQPPPAPAKPSVAAAPAVADDQIQSHIKDTMAKLNMEPCPAGYEFVKTDKGYRCKGGSHFVSFEQLGMKH
ncbi:hypothetical protein MSAN_01559300 [Mycena sanguinolenta]|uniref:Uncharacterized protein n=1 Tax=Mycena sanguinolenta TaxID=230812 RepID=A0A8H6Y103_9AGAR|nr:hypothetical protein MSAN_01559300 [Mycena sanguinolenta]